MNNDRLFNKIWEILKPFIIYYFLYCATFILFLSLCQVIAQGLGHEYQAYLAEHEGTVTELVSGLSMIISVLPLIPMLRRELTEHKRSLPGMIYENSTMTGNKVGIDIEQRVKTAYKDAYAEGVEEGGRKKRSRVLLVCLTVILAAASSLGLNVLLGLTGLVESSAGYQDVAKQQYSVVFGAGMILFGLISPITEEIVFRGLIFNRMRRYFPHAAAVIVSGVLFGVYHGNLVQGVYGGCMGILMAYLYERMHSFFIPCLFHATANLMVYSIAQSVPLHGMIFTVQGCAVLLAVAVFCVVIIEKTGFPE